MNISYIELVRTDSTFAAKKCHSDSLLTTNGGFTGGLFTRVTIERQINMCADKHDPLK